MKKIFTTKRARLWLLVPVLGLAFVAFVSILTSAASYLSLSHIEAIKTRTRFTVVEIVPGEGLGSVGYYIRGQEPTADWRERAAKRTTPESRKAEMDSLFGQLESAGLMGGDHSTPLEKTSGYAESFPWENAHGGTRQYLMDENRALRQETTKVRGTFAAVGAGEGQFTQNNTPRLVESGGTHVQDVISFAYAAQTEDGYYYYNPVFTELTITDDNEALAGLAVYQAVSSENPPVQYMQYSGKIGEDGFAVDIEQTYYYVTSTGAPAAVWSLDAPYRAQAAGFAVQADGYFTMDVNGYVFVGPEKGDFNFTADEMAAEASVAYDHVYMSGGYTNNQWFLRHVFDAETPDDLKHMAVQVHTVVPGTTPEEHASALLQSADLIVLSPGFRLDGAALPQYDSAHDLTTAQIELLAAALQESRAVVMDGRLQEGAAQVNHFIAEQMRNKPAGGFVQDSLYCFVPDAQRTALATKHFTQGFTEGIGKDQPYYPVAEEIEYENFLRNQTNVATLPTDVHMANCIRYIINFAGKRVQNKKTSIRILEVQPNTPGNSSTDSRRLKIGGGGEMDVTKWLPAGAIDPANITITTLSSAEFIGKIDDINEQYDLIYIGDSLAGFDITNSGETRYNDSKMNGLLYANIGDTYNSNVNLSGLLDRDYNNGTVRNGSQSYRFSGNDITPVKKAQLENFAQSGFPVVLASSLVKEGTPATYAAFSAEITAASTGSGLRLQAEPRMNPAVSGLTYTYQWWTMSGGNRIPLSYATNAVYQTQMPGVYGCEVAVVSGGTRYAVQTKGVDVAQGGFVLTKAAGAAASFYPIAIERVTAGNNLRYRATIEGYSGSATYRWYGSSTRNNRGSVLSGESADYTPAGSRRTEYYICGVTIGQTTYYSQQIRQHRSGRPPQVSIYDADITTTSVLELTAGESEATLHAAFSDGITRNVTYTWYRDDIRMSDGANTITVDQTGTYYCSAAFGGLTVQSGAYTATHGWTGTVQSTGGTTMTIPVQAAVPERVNPDRIDDSALLYAVLNQALPKANVLPASEAVQQPDVVLKYLNLSKPSIAFAEGNSKPAAYTGAIHTTLNDGTLVYQFEIKNPTDSTPVTTRYRCRLYLDQNGDGRYVAAEELTDLTITAGRGRVEASALQGSTESGRMVYTVSRGLPDTFSGIIPWKLVVEKVGAEGQIHASEIGYTYIKPKEAVKLNILQIRTVFSLEAPENNKASSNYGRLFSELRGSPIAGKPGEYDGIYHIMPTARTITEVNNGSGWTLSAAERAIARKGENTNWLDTVDELAEYFSQYDMLILGFADVYGNLNKHVAQAVVKYIESGKSILFTHDTTSFNNNPKSGTWGYEFNAVVRNAVGLDRYGVRDTTYGITRGPENRTGGVVAASTNTAISEADQQKLIEKGYSVAYQPKSNRTKTVEHTQGYSALTMRRYTTGDNGIATTTTVSQINQGQITTFPYLLSGETLDVKTTHEQYYQLNMNADDVVVWYTLGGERYASMKNDAVNNYYIYNRGNITYSGAGHVAGDTTLNEAKLFVNTMIAAYRAGAVKPAVQFQNAQGSNTNSVFLPMEYKSTESGYQGDLLIGSDGAAMQALYFRVEDFNLAAGKNTRVQLYYADPTGGNVTINGKTVRARPIEITYLYTVDNNGTETAVPNANLQSGIRYKVYIPQSILTAFANQNAASLEIYIQAITEIDQIPYIGDDTLTLHKTGLLSLR